MKPEQKFDEKQQEKEAKKNADNKFRQKEDKLEETLVRILSTDIPGNKSLLVGLTRIKGISFSFSNALCHILKMDKSKKIIALTPAEIEKISKFIQSPEVPEFLKNRRKDYETGEDKHLIGADWDMQKEFDIKRLRKIKSYKGWRHATGQPVRGQRTKSHFRKNKTVGVTTRKKAAK